MWLLVVVLLNGHEVRLNPEQVVSLVQARDASDPMKHYTADVRCVVVMTDGNRYTTKEECTDIAVRLKKLKEGAPPP